jgi:hypothetical protein
MLSSSVAMRAFALASSVACRRSDELVELVAGRLGAVDAQRRGLGVGRHGGHRRGDRHQVARGQPLHDEEDEERHQKGLGGVAQEDDRALHQHVAVDVGQRGLDAQRADPARVRAAADERELAHDRAAGRRLPARDGEPVAGGGQLAHLHRADRGQLEDAVELLLQQRPVHGPQALAQARGHRAVDLGEAAVQAGALAAIAQAQLQQRQQ